MKHLNLLLCCFWAWSTLASGEMFSVEKKLFMIHALRLMMLSNIPATIDKERNIWTITKNTSSMLTELCWWSEPHVTCLHCARFTDQLNTGVRNTPELARHKHTPTWHYLLFTPQSSSYFWEMLWQLNKNWWSDVNFQSYFKLVLNWGQKKRCWTPDKWMSSCEYEGLVKKVWS